MAASKKRVLIIGLDGFTWSLGRRFMAEGSMPHLKELVEQGCHGNLKSVMPFETSPAWSSFQTGCLPGKTGIFSFHTYDRRQNKVRLNSFSDIAVPSIWEIASHAGKRVVSLNMPISSPPPKVNGVIIPGLLCPKLSEQTVYPPEAYGKYIKPHKDYLIVNKSKRKTVRQSVKQAIDAEKVRCKVALEMIKDIDWDIFSVQIQSTDVLQHSLWWTMEPTAKGYSPEENQEVLGFYRYCDRAIKDIIDAAGPEVLKFIVSDHGFCTMEGSVGINVWLKQNGYLHLLPEGPESTWSRIKRKAPPLKSLAGVYGRIAKSLKRPDKTTLFCETNLIHMRRVIDFEKTQALCLGGLAGLIYIKGSHQERTKLAEKTTGQLLDEFGPGSEKPVIANIKSGAQVYGRTDTKDILPDLVIELNNGINSRISPFGEEVFSLHEPEGKQQGTHSRDGIFIANGPGTQTGTTLNAEIIDIVPTALGYLGVAIPKHLDGNVLDEAFVEPIPVNYEDITFDRSKSIQYSDDEQIKVEQQLSDLGYI